MRIATICVFVTACGSNVTGQQDFNQTADSSCSIGTERCGCYGNDTCNDGLICLFDTCVQSMAGDSDIHVGDSYFVGDSNSLGDIYEGDQEVTTIEGDSFMGGDNFVDPNECDPADPAYCTDNRFLADCRWDASASAYKIVYDDCWYLDDEQQWRSYNTCQSGVISDGEVVDRCQCKLNNYICFPNPCAGTCNPAALLSQCEASPLAPGDTRTRRVTIEICLLPESCAPDAYGQESSSILVCQIY